MDYSVTSKDIPEVFNMWGEIFTFQKKYYNPPILLSDKSNEDEVNLFWNKCVAESDELAEKYKNMKLCLKVLIAILEDINERGNHNGEE